MRLQDNQWFGIQGGRDIGLLWVYNNRVHDWYRRLSPEVQQELGAFDDPDSFSGFPNYSTLSTDLDATQINLLASLSAWVVADGDNAEAFLAMYGGG